MTAKYYRGLAGIEEIREKTCTICVHANPLERVFTHMECMCEKSEHYCHVFVAWHPACDQYQQGIKPENAERIVQSGKR